MFSPGFVTWTRLAQKRWASDKANHTCENMLYFIQVDIFDGDFLASADITAFGRT